MHCNLTSLSITNPDRENNSDILLTNPQVEGSYIRDLSQLCHMNLIVSRLIHPDGEDELPDVDTVLHVGDRIRIVTHESYQIGIIQIVVLEERDGSLR